MSFILPKGKITLSEVVQSSEDDHAQRQRRVAAKRGRKPAQKPFRQRFRRSVSGKITNRNDSDKTHGRTPAAACISECKPFVQHIGEKTSDDVVCRRRKPIRTVRRIVKKKHQRRPDKRIERADGKKFNQFPICPRKHGLLYHTRGGGGGT